MGALGLFAAAQDPPRGGTLLVGTTQVPRHLNGAVQSGVATGLASTQLFASPLRFDDQWRPMPYLAETWHLAEDGKTLTLRLRRNAVFHDGAPITSEDVAFSIQQVRQHHPFKSMLDAITAVDTPDGHTVVLRMRTPHPAILQAMSPALMPILPKHIYGDGTDLKIHPRNSHQIVGSGPFKLVEFRPGQSIVLERFDRFFIPGRPYLDKIVFNINPEHMQLVMALERGKVHMLPFVSGSMHLRRLNTLPGVALTSKGFEGIGGLNWLAFNMAKPPLSDGRVRKAIAHAIDKNFITKVLMGGFAQPADGPIVPDSPFFSKDLARYPLDLAKSNRLLDASGLKPDAQGERLRLTVDFLPGDDEQQRNVAEYLRSQLRKVGIVVEVRISPDFPSWARRMVGRDFDMSMDTVFNWGDPIIGVHRTYLSTNILPMVWTNTQSYVNQEVDLLLQAAAQTQDTATRREHYARFQRIVTEDLPIVFINQSPFHTATTRNVGNVPASIWGPLSPYDEVYLR
jgi:peptide/nickel transport system substrate-binding protein